jgi:hypothetical protein
LEVPLESSGMEVAHHVEVALDSDGGKVDLGIGRCQAHGGAGVEAALGSSDVETAHHVEADFSVEAVLDSDGG